MAIIQQLVEFLAPAQCLNCGRPGNLVCPACLPSLAIVKTPTCWRCNRLSPGGRTCASCRSSSKLAGVVVASHYDGAVKSLVKAIKYQNAMGASRIAAGLVTPLLRMSAIGDFDLVTSVPSAAPAYRRRGYNQAELIAKIVAADLALPYRSLLGRLTAARQVGHNRAQRLEQVRGRFYATSPVPLKTKVLIIDDVLTTGATLNECATVLKAAGAARVWGAVVAKH